MKNFVLKLLVNAVGLYVASLLLKSGITFQASSGWARVESVLIVALVFGLVNTFIRPVVKLFSLGVRLLTLGLFTFVINALMLWLTSLLFQVYANSHHVQPKFHVSGFVPALLGSLIITAVSIVLNWVLPDGDKGKGRSKPRPAAR